MNRLKLLATATLMALTFTACDEGTPPPVEPPPPPTPVGTISGTVTIEGTAASGITATLSSGATTTTGSGGSFAFSGVEAGTYTVTISGFPEDATFAQVTQSATIATDGQNVQLNFAGEYIRSSSVVGNVVAADAMMSGGDGQPETLVGVTVTLGGEHDLNQTVVLDPIVLQYTTQTLKVYVHHEMDQVMGYTGNVLGGDVRMSGMVDVEVRYIAENGRSRQFPTDMWDAAKNTKDDKKGGLTFSHLPADKDVIVIATAAEDENVMVLDPDELAAYTDDDGAMGGHFGAEGGYSPSVTLCPLQETAPQDHDECASFAFVNTYAVDGQVWKNGVERDDHDGFDTHEITEDPKDPVAVKDIMVDMAPVMGKNLVDEGNSHNSTDKDGDATIEFDFEDMADGVYSVTVTDGWTATAGMGGDKLPKEFLLSDVVDDDGALNIDVTPTTGVLYGTVTDSKGQAVDGVTVDVNGSTDMTDEFGRFIVDGFGAAKDKDGDPARIVTLSGEGISEKTDTLSGFDANELAMMDFAVEGAADLATISGTVTKSGGGGVAGVRISVSGSTLVGLPTSGKNKGKLVTGSDGSYVAKVVALEAGGTVTVSASADGMSFAPASHEVSAVKDSRISGIDFTAFDHATITGRVLDSDGGPVERVMVTATLVGASSAADSYTTRKTGTFRLSVPFGTYDIAGASDGFDYEYPNGVQRVTVAPGQALAFGDITADVSANGRPPRFTSSASFSVGEGKREIGTVEAVDDDADDEVTGYSVTGGADMEMFAITATGVLSWASTTPAFDDSDDPDNKYEVEVDATSGEGTREMSATQDITVTVTASGNLVVELSVDPDEISEAGGTSTVTASLNRAAESSFYVIVAVDRDDVRLSSNTRLFIDEGDDESSGSAVTITAINDNVYTGEREVTVSGTPEPASSEIDVESADLTITDDDVPPGAVVLRLAKGRIDESDDVGTTDASENQDTLTAVLVGGTTFDQVVTVTVTVSPDGAVTPADTDGDDANGQQIGTLTIPAGSRSSLLNADGTDKTTDHQIAITAVGDDEDGGNTTVTVSGAATVPDTDADTDTDPDALADDNQPADVSLVILDDDDAAGPPEDLEVARSTTTTTDDTPTYTVTWEAPSNPGTTNGAAVDAATLIYQYRFERSEVIGDAAWTALSAGVVTTEIGLHTLTGVSGDELGPPVVPGNWRNRSFTVQVRVGTDNGTMVAKEFTTPAAGS